MSQIGKTTIFSSLLSLLLPLIYLPLSITNLFIYLFIPLSTDFLVKFNFTSFFYMPMWTSFFLIIIKFRLYSNIVVISIVYVKVATNLFNIHLIELTFHLFLLAIIRFYEANTICNITLLPFFCWCLFLFF